MPSSKPRPTAYRPTDRFLLRTAACPFALDPDPGAGLDWRAAVAIASPDLGAELARRPAGEPLPIGARRYLRRMATRATPFGLFSSVAIGRWGEGQPPRLTNPIAHVAAAADGGWLAELIAMFETEPAVRAALAWYWHGGDARDAALSYPIDPAEAATLRTVAERAREGATIADLAALADEALVERLIAERKLVSELFFPFRGDPLATLVGVAERHQLPIAAPLATIGADLAALGDAPVTAEAVAGVTARMRALTPGHAGPTLRVDAAAQLDGVSLPEEIGIAAAEAAELLLRLTPWTYGALDFWNYELAFNTRYGDVEVPLLDLIDPVRGIGMPDRAEPGQGTVRDAALLALAAEALASGATELELDDARLAGLEPDKIGRNALPRATEVKCQVAAAGPEALSRGDWRLVLPPDQFGWPGGRMVGRFASLLGSEARAMLAEVADAELEWDSGVLPVELLFSPEGRDNLNPCCRSEGRGFAIALDTAPDVPSRRRIWLEDVVVGLREGKGFYFRWTKGDVELRPSAWCAFNPMLMPAPLQFMLLASVARRRVMASFAWGSAALLPRTPRLVRGRIVLAPACWTLGADAAPVRAARTGGGFDAALEAWRRLWSVPDLVQIGSADRRLLLDLTKAEDRAELARRILAEPGHLRLTECLPRPGQQWLQGPDGAHVSELVVPLLLNGAKRLPKSRHVIARPARLAEERRVGSDWLAIHVEAPFDRHPALASGPLADLGQGLVAAGAADGWTFVRYAFGEGPHIRFRLHGDAERLRDHALPRVDAALGELIERGAIAGFEYRTYRREIGRYGGGRMIDQVEAAFIADSRWCAALLRAASHAPVRPGREALCAWSLERLLRGLKLPEEGWYRLAGMADGGGSETGELLRRDKPFLLEPLGAGDWRLALEAEAYAEALGRAADAMRALERDGIASRSLDEMATDIAHMHCNRLVGVDRPAELRARQLVVRVQRSRAARTKMKVTI